MRRRAVLLVVALAAAGGCDSGPGAYDPCAGKRCGERCTLCPPDAKDCVETAEVKVCDPSGRCVSDSGSICPG